MTPASKFATGVLAVLLVSACASSGTRPSERLADVLRVEISRYVVDAGAPEDSDPVIREMFDAVARHYSSSSLLYLSGDHFRQEALTTSSLIEKDSYMLGRRRQSDFTLVSQRLGVQQLKSGAEALGIWTGTVLLDANKYEVKNLTVEHTGQTGEVAGLVCRKSRVVITSETMPSVVELSTRRTTDAEICHTDVLEHSVAPLLYLVLGAAGSFDAATQQRVENEIGFPVAITSIVREEGTLQGELPLPGSVTMKVTEVKRNIPVSSHLFMLPERTEASRPDAASNEP